MDTTRLQFNIIYTPETVRYLTPFVTTLLRWSDCHYRLIANGCREHEVALLQRVAELDPRLELLVMPGERMIPHGDMLNFLQKREQSTRFCFMDSDVLATGPFIDEFRADIETSDCFSSCLPLWHNDEDIVIPHWLNHMHGIHAYTPDGRTIACDYFVVYDNDKLSQVMQESDVNMAVTGWQTLPEDARATLVSMGQRKKDYDTGKVPTLLMSARGDTITYRGSDKLQHIGGFTEVGARQGALLYSRGMLDRLVSRVPGRPGNSLIRAADHWYARRAGDPQKSAAERRLLAGRIRRRTSTARYFYLLLVGLMDDMPVPDVPRLGDPTAEHRIRAVSEEIRELIAGVRRNPGTWQDAAG